MSLSAGARLGPYEIVSALGSGGMGEVYRARDTRLDRTVAIKVLKSTLGSPELKQRFEREARTISQLNHPHICTLYDVGHENGTDFLVMEYLEGETLAARLNKGALPLRELVSISVDILSALEQAHRAGIVHRDLKPGNVMLTKSGSKLLDFGLAKTAMHGAMPGSGSAPLLSAAMTMSSPASPLTSAGTLVGTVQYMSPEQLEGKEADARSDIFAFGAMLYEMATGRRAFAGKSQIKVASAIMEDDPQAISEFQPALPSSLEHVVRTCLQKAPDERYQSAHDIAVQLKWMSQSPAERSSRMSAGVNRWLAAALIVCALAGIAGYFLLRPRPAQPIALGILPTPGVSFNFSGLSGPPAFSPDGTLLAMVGTDATGARLLYVRSLGHSNAQVIQGTSGASYPFWSPDGKKVAFFTSDALKVADIAGGSVLQISPVSEGRGGTWNEHGEIVFGTRTTGLMRLPASGGTPVPLTKLAASQSSHRFPIFFPDGEHVAFVVQGADRAHAYVVSLSDPRPAEIAGVISNVAFYGDRIFHVREDGTLLTQRLDSRRLSLDPNPEVVAKPVGYDGQFNYSAFTVAAQSSAIAYEEGSGSTANEIVWYDRSGKQLGVLPNVLIDSSGLGLRISPRGDRLLYSGSNARRSDIWVVQLAKGTRTRISLGPEGGATGVWSPDGSRVAYQNRIGGGTILVRTSDGIGSEHALTNLPGEVLPIGWSQDGKYIVFEFITSAVPVSAREIWVAPADGSEPPHAILHGVSTFGTDLSPDSKWLAYTSDESGRLEVYVIPFDPHATVANSLAAGKWQISAEGGHQPRWSRSGKEIQYANPSLTTLYSASVQTSAGRFERGEITKLFDLPPHAPWSFYDVNRDGHIYMFRYVGRQSSPLTILLNWKPAGK